MYLKKNHYQIKMNYRNLKMSFFYLILAVQQSKLGRECLKWQPLICTIYSLRKNHYTLLIENYYKIFLNSGDSFIQLVETILILSIFNRPFGMDLVCCNFFILDFIASKCSRHDTPIRYSSFSITDNM